MTPENTVRFIAFQNGDVHGMDGIVPDDVPALRRDERFQLLTQPGMNVGYLAMNCDREPFGDVRVRQAVAMGINVQDMIDAMGPDGGTPLVGVVSPISAWV